MVKSSVNDNNVVSIRALTYHVMDPTFLLLPLKIDLELIKLGRKPNHLISPGTEHETLFHFSSKS
jgi:hypothetical protein